MTEPLGQGGHRRYDVPLVVQEHRPLTDRLAGQLRLSPSLQVAPDDEEEARRKVRDGSAVAAVILPEGLEADLLAGRSPRLTLVRQGESNVYLYARQEVERAVTRLASAVVAADLSLKGSGITGNGVPETATRGSEEWLATVDAVLARWSDPALSIGVTEVRPPGAGRPLRQVDQKAIGFALMIIFMSVMLSSGTVLSERAAGTWQRLIATPVSRTEIIVGYVLGYFASGWVQFGLMILETRLIFGANWGNPLGLAAVGSLFILASGALGLVLAGFVKTHQQQASLVSLIGVTTAMLSGLFWPLEATSRMLQTVARAMPQYWAAVGLTGTVSRGVGWLTLGTPLLVLGGMTMVFLIVGISRVRFE